MIRFVVLIVVGAGSSLAIASSYDDASFRSFLHDYCLRCHGKQKQQGDRRFDALTSDSNKLNELESLQEILDQLNLSSMPPEEELQPSDEEVRQVVALLTASLAKARAEARDDSGKVVMRRLNRSEYRNTIRDLFQLKMVDFDPTTTFPEDDATEGFDNVGEGLVASDYLLRNYLQAARKVVNKAIVPGDRPEMIRYHVGASHQKNPLGYGSADKDDRREAGRMYIKFRQPLGVPLLDKKRGVPVDGEYVIRCSAKAVRRKSRYKDEDLRYQSDEPMRLSISIDSRELGATAHRIIGEYEIPDDEVLEIEHRVWLEKGFTFHLHWANGPAGSFKRILRKVLPKYNKDALYPIRNPPEMYVGSGPELHVHSIEIEGPFYDQWPPPGFARFFPEPTNGQYDKEYLDACLVRVASEAFRRPVQETELVPYLGLAHSYFENHGDIWGAAKYGVRAILTSPHFLYLAELDPGKGASRRVTHHELAARLSYFLWSSMPDQKLRADADAQRLFDPDVLRGHVSRMLSDSKSAAFTQNFTGQWLRLRKLGDMPPDPEKNRSYYDDDLEEAMRKETHLFFDYVLHNNRSILEFIDSDYTFLNPQLARHYGISGVSQDIFQKVSLGADAHRGGLLGHGSILTATSNGIETQPVVRGVWVLENLFGTPPSPPPPDIEPIEPDTRGVVTIRELMEKHRSNPTCYECHRKIDPLGLSMEKYDHVGAWRDRYSKKSLINEVSELPDGTKVSGARGIKDYLLRRPEQFARCLTEKLFIYAMGRRLSFTDHDDVEEIITSLKKKDFGFRELIHMITESEAFHTK